MISLQLDKKLREIPLRKNSKKIKLTWWSLASPAGVFRGDRISSLQEASAS